LRQLHTSISEKAFTALLYTFFVVSIFITVYPFWNLAVYSFNNPLDSIRGELYFWPRIFTTVSYTTIFNENPSMVTATINSVLRTVIGTIVNVVCCTLLGYILSCREFIWRNFLNKYLVFTMYVTAGLIPTFILYKDLHLLNTFAVYIVPNLLSAYYVIIIRTYMQELPQSLTEAAKIDGARHMQIFVKIIIPLSMPVIATIALFIAVWQWSAWQDTNFFASSNIKLTTLQYEMKKVLVSVSNLTDAQIKDLVGKDGATKATSQSLQAAMTIIATVPILIVYPFLQKYFVNGVTIGAVKE